MPTVPPFVLAFFALFFGTAAAAFALQPNEIALIVNRNEPAGAELARFYVKARQLPENRILELDLPKTEEMSFKDYEETVVPQVREFLRTSGSGSSIKCFVTFYGVPLRVAARVNTPDENNELTNLRQELLKTAASAAAPVAALETLAKEVSPDFQPVVGNDLDHLGTRATNAEREILGLVQSKPAIEREKLTSRFLSIIQPLAGDAMKVKQMAIEQALRGTTQPADETAVMAAKDEYDRIRESAADLEQARYSAKARGALRQLVSKHFGYFSYVKLLREQTDYLNPADSTAAFDNELSLVKWIAYPRQKWLINPFFYAAQQKNAALVPTTYMVMRLDAPKPETVKDIIMTSIETENHGLHGKVVLDSRGLDPATAKGTELSLAEYDQRIRDLHTLLQNSTHLEIVADDKPAILPAHSEDQVALYCGWYSVHQYVPCCTFSPGAVGFHIASYELLSLHNPGEPGWVAGLLRDGIDATLGPVAEPYIVAFPRPDDFFPLLLTGRLTLAEVYWRSTPLTSWMMSAIGDPLYTPYKTNPALDIKDLPARLQGVFLPPPPTPPQ